MTITQVSDVERELRAEIARLTLALAEQPAQQRHISYACPQCHWSLEEQPAQQQEPVAWRELCRRLYVELFHCDWQMTAAWDEEGGPMWQQGATVRDVLADAKAALETSPPAQRKPHDCARSHPHENMDAICELRTEIARLTNENARLKAQPQQEPEIVQRVKRYAGQTLRTARNPNITARECIELANWLAAHGIKGDA